MTIASFFHGIASEEGRIAPSPEAIRDAAQKNALSVNKITEIRVLDPYFYH